MASREIVTGATSSNSPEGRTLIAKVRRFDRLSVAGPTAVATVDPLYILSAIPGNAQGGFNELVHLVQRQFNAVLPL